MITHDLGVVAEIAHRVIVMYAGRKVEEAEVDALFAAPLHPYTGGLMASVPGSSLFGGEGYQRLARLKEIPGIVPSLVDLPPGCAFAPRCAFADERCRAEYPSWREMRPRHWVACWHPELADGAGDG